MAGLLQEALRRVETLSNVEQDAIAAQIMETLDTGDAWSRGFQRRPEVLHRLADEALTEHRREEKRPLEELLG